jgi:tripartite-type tricarboxylate transporter receptor subunit TctC
MTMKLASRILIACSILFFSSVSLAFAQEAYFNGKTIRIIAGFPSGGGVDAEARMLARFLPSQIPGNPTIIVQNMPGAGGTVASNWFEQFAKPDGLTLHYTSTTSINQQAMGVKEAKHDLRSWPVIGSVRRGTSVALIRKKVSIDLRVPVNPSKSDFDRETKVGTRSFCGAQSS